MTKPYEVTIIAGSFQTRVQANSPVEAERMAWSEWIEGEGCDFKTVCLDRQELTNRIDARLPHIVSEWRYRNGAQWESVLSPLTTEELKAFLLSHDYPDDYQWFAEECASVLVDWLGEELKLVKWLVKERQK